MKYFRPAWPWFPEPPIEGEYGFGLPLVECPTCKNSKSASGLSYPWIDVETIFDNKAIRRITAKKNRGVVADKDCSWEEYKNYAQEIRKKTNANYPLPPGVRFGPFLGEVYDPPENFVLADPCRVLASRAVIKQLARDGFVLKTFDVKLKSKLGTYDYVELRGPTIGWSVGIKYCTECERGDIGGTMVPVLRHETIPPDIHLFRPKDALNFIVFSEALVNVIMETGFTGIKFKELPTNQTS